MGDSERPAKFQHVKEHYELRFLKASGGADALVLPHIVVELARQCVESARKAHGSLPVILEDFGENLFGLPARIHDRASANHQENAPLISQFIERARYYAVVDMCGLLLLSERDGQRRLDE